LRRTSEGDFTIHDGKHTNRPNIVCG